MQHPSNGSSGGRNGHRFSPPTETVPLRAGGRSGPPGNGAGGSSDRGQEPKRLQVRRPRREDLRAVANGARQTWRSIVRVMALVWATSPQADRSLSPAPRSCRASPRRRRSGWPAVSSTRSSPASQPADGRSMSAPSSSSPCIQLVLLLGSSFLQTAGNISQQLLQERLAIHVQLQIMRHAATLDLADFENAAYYDQLQQAQRESARRPVADGLRRLRPRPLARHLRHDGRPPPRPVALGGGRRADRADPGLHLRLPLRLVGVPA